MDKKTRNIIIGVVAIALIVGWYFFMREPTNNGMGMELTCYDLNGNLKPCSVPSFALVEFPSGTPLTPPGGYGYIRLSPKAENPSTATTNLKDVYIQSVTCKRSGVTDSACEDVFNVIEGTTYKQVLNKNTCHIWNWDTTKTYTGTCTRTNKLTTEGRIPVQTLIDGIYTIEATFCATDESGLIGEQCTFKGTATFKTTQEGITLLPTIVLG